MRSHTDRDSFTGDHTRATTNYRTNEKRCSRISRGKCTIGAIARNEDPFTYGFCTQDAEALTARQEAVANQRIAFP